MKYYSFLVICMIVLWVCGLVVIFVVDGLIILLIRCSFGLGSWLVCKGSFFGRLLVVDCVCMKVLMIWFFSEWKEIIIRWLFGLSNLSVCGKVIFSWWSFWLIWICRVWKLCVVGFCFGLWVCMVVCMMVVNWVVVIIGCLSWVVIIFFVIWKVNCFLL